MRSEDLQSLRSFFGSSQGHIFGITRRIQIYTAENIDRYIDNHSYMHWYIHIHTASCTSIQFVYTYSCTSTLNGLLTGSKPDLTWYILWTFYVDIHVCFITMHPLCCLKCGHPVTCPSGGKFFWNLLTQLSHIWHEAKVCHLSCKSESCQPWVLLKLIAIKQNSPGAS